MSSSPLMRGSRVLVALAAAAGLVVAGCGDDEEAASSAASSNGGNVEKSARLDSLLKGTYGEPPADSPAPVSDQNVYVISCGEVSVNCARWTNGLKEAGAAIGWKVTMIDSKGEPNLQVEAYRKAVAAGADVIVAPAVDCPTTKQSMKEANDAGAVIIGLESADCDDSPQFDAIVSYEEGSFPEWFKALGAAQAQLAQALVEDPATLWIKETDIPNLFPQTEGFEESMKQCTSCSHADVEFTAPDLLNNKLEQKIGQALAQNPDVNVLGIPYEAVLELGATAALRTSGRLKDVTLIASEGQESTMDLFRSGQFKGGGTGIPLEWESYAAIDAANRLLNDEKPVSSGIGIQVFTETENMSKSGPWEPPVDYRAAYKAAWGVD